MLVINGLKSTTTLKSFEDFNNMFKAIDPQSYTSTYIAILVYDKVILECNPTRSHDANAWFNGGWYPLRQQQQQSESFSDEDSVGDIVD